MKLVIIEGAGKKETIEKYLGKDYKVFATKGHVRDLPAKSLAININNNFEPKYVILEDKKDIVKDLLAKAERADEVYLATDPDREGEAISWHLAHILGISPNQNTRIVFNEISKKAIDEALKNPRAIDIDLVNAQQARRVLDRLVGYKLSPVLCKKIQNKLSAGRVQSVALKIIVDREREILNFVPVEFWNLIASLKKLDGDYAPFKAQLLNYKGKKIKINNKEEAEKAANAVQNGEWIVESVKKSVSRSRAPAPFITSTLGQDALNKLSLSLKQTSLLAQQLYEGVDLAGEGKVALVTYIRTDSTRVSKQAQDDALEFIKNKFGEKYCPSKPNYYASKSNSQDAHEAIRPITLSRDPESIKNMVDKNLYRLYKLIYDRFLASQMSEAEYNAVTADIACGDYTYRASGKTLLFEGYLAAYSIFEEKNEDDDIEARVPPLEKGEQLKLLNLEKLQKFTKPPSRFTEAGLIKVMEEKGIGRPATYSPTISTLFARAYMVKEAKALVPTELGFSVTDMLVKYFPDIIDVGFTAEMESKLDGIGDGETPWQTLVGDFYKDFSLELAQALGDSFSLKEPPKPTNIECTKCGANMIIRKGRFGEFLACPNFPKCKNTMQMEQKEEKAVEHSEPATASAEPCEKCGGAMVEKSGRYGKFLACSNFPECKNIRKNSQKKQENEQLGNCPDCGKALRRLRSRTGKSFISCSGYPDCKFTTNYPVYKDKCPKCGKAMAIKKGAAVCLDCAHSFSIEDKE